MFPVVEVEVACALCEAFMGREGAMHVSTGVTEALKVPLTQKNKQHSMQRCGKWSANLFAYIKKEHRFVLCMYAASSLLLNSQSSLLRMRQAKILFDVSLESAKEAHF